MTNARCFFPIVLNAIAACGLCQTASVSTFTQQGAKLYGTGAVSASQQGFSVAISADGNTAIAGGPADNPNGTQGAAWVYTRSNGLWSQQGTKLIPMSDAAPGNAGWSVALSADGNTALIGAPNDNSSQFTGAAFIFTRTNGAWTQQQKLVGRVTQGGAYQGSAVALSGDGMTAVIGGPGDNRGIGAAWVFTLNNGTWAERQKLTVLDNSGIAQVGYSVAISRDGSTIMLGGPTDSTIASNAQGAAWIFTLSNNTWTQQGAKLVARAPFMSEQGVSVALSTDGNTAAIGGPISSGGAWIFTRSNGLWSAQGGQLTGPAGNTQAGNGQAVALSGDGNTLIVGGPGVNDAWVFTRSIVSGTPTWTRRQELTENPPPDGINELTTTWFGYSTAISADGSTIVVGGPRDSSQSTANLGGAWVLAANATSIAATAGTPQAAQLGTTFATNLTAMVYSAPNVPAAGVTVTFTAPSSGPSGTFPGSSVTATAVSDSSGNVQAPSFTANNIAGSYSVTAAAPGISAPTSFSLTNSTVSSVNITLQTSPPGLLVKFDNDAYTPGPITESLAVSSTHTIAAQSPQPGSGTTLNIFQFWSDGQALSHTISVPATDTTYLATFQTPGSLPTGQFQQQGSKLVASGANGAARQGYAVAISADGNTAIVGAPIDSPGAGSTNDNPYGQGAAFVWTRSNGVWSQQKLTTPDAVSDQLFGASVGLSADGNTAIVGGPGDAYYGAAWIFTRSNGVWTQNQKLSISGPAVAIDNLAGASVALSGDGMTALVGAPAYRFNGGGGWIFTRSGNAWTQQAQLNATGLSGQNQVLGYSVSLSNDGNTAILGAPLTTPDGSAVIFSRSGTTWTQQGSPLTTSAGTGSSPGEAVALSGDGSTALLGLPNNQGNPGQALLFTLSSGLWTQQGGLLTAPRSGTPSFLSNYVSLSSTGNLAVVGGPADNAVGVFLRTAGVWSAQPALTPTDPNGTSLFGTSAAISADGSTVIVGGPQDNNYTGAAWIFTVATNSNNSTTTALSASPNPATFGQNVTLTATVSNTSGAAITGTVNFMDGATSLNSANVSNGTANLTLNTLSLGTHSLTAVYSGDANNLASASPGYSLTVNQSGSNSISGHATYNGAALAGVTVTVSGAQTASSVTDVNGFYSIPILAGGGTYVMTATLAGYSFGAPVTLSSVTSSPTVNFTGILGLDFYAVTPCRVADTRVSTMPSGFGPPAFSAREARTYNIRASPCAAGIPANVAAYSLNFTVVPPSGGPAANLTTYPAGTAIPNASTLNYSGTVVANAAIVPDSSGGITVYANYPTQVLFDINGYFAPPAAGGLTFFTVSPCRIADTRVSSFPSGFGQPSFTGGEVRQYNILSGPCSGIPASASAYSLNFTVVPPGSGPPANLTTYPAGPNVPVVSTLNYSNYVVANAGIVPAASSGAIDVTVNYPTNVLFDVNGYFAPPTAGLHFYPVTPCRVADTRVSSFPTGFGPPGFNEGETRSYNIRSSPCGGNIPAGVAAYSLNFTVVPPAGRPAANLTTWPTGTAMPNVSTLNYYGSVVAGAAIVPASSGSINVSVTYPTNVLFDINGYFAQ